MRHTALFVLLALAAWIAGCRDDRADIDAFCSRGHLLIRDGTQLAELAQLIDDAPSEIGRDVALLVAVATAIETDDEAALGRADRQDVARAFENVVGFLEEECGIDVDGP